MNAQLVVRSVRRRRCIRAAVWCLVLALSCVRVASLHAQGRVSKEYQLKAAVIHKVIGFIDWRHDKAEGDAALNVEICVVGKNPFGDSLERLIEYHSVPERSVTVRHLRGDEPLGGCSIIFVSRSVAGERRELLEYLGTSPVVTVSDIEGFAEDGGMIELAVENNAIKFIINRTKVRKAGVHISSQLLSLAKQLVLGNLTDGLVRHDIPAA